MECDRLIEGWFVKEKRKGGNGEKRNIWVQKGRVIKWKDIKEK